MEASVADLPQWVGIAVAAGIAALVGGLIGVLFAHNRGVSKAEGGIDPQLDAPANAPLSRENPAFRQLQEVLRATGISAKEQDTQLRDFAGEFAIIHRKLRDLRPIGEARTDVAVRALAALEAGEFEDAIKLTEGLGKDEGSEGHALRERSVKLLAASAAARVIAADLYMVLIAPENARVLYEQAIEELPATADERRAEVLNKLGTACYQCGDHDAAVRAFTRGLRLLEKTIGTDHPDVATSLNNLALIHYSKGRYDQAEPLLKRALSIKERTFDPGHPSLVTGLKNYASVLRSLGRTEEAKEFEDRAASLPPSRTESAA